MIEAVIWFLMIELIGIAALPVAFQVFRFLPERGYTLAKPLGLLGTGYLVWLVSMLGLPFNPLVCWLGFILLFVTADGWLLLRQGRRLLRDMGAWFARHAWFVLLVELVFLLAYAYLLNMRSYTPEIRDYEKFGDFAFLKSLTLSDKMPPYDPWMSGYPINYYYFSHFMMAMLIKMTGVDPDIAFNLIIAGIFALTCLAVLGIGYNMVRLVQGLNRTWRHALLFGLLALVMVCVMGNLDSVRQIFWPNTANGETGITNFVFSWWWPSRVIWDYMPDASSGGLIYTWSQTINEFPQFSFLIADIHPHVMTLPFALLAIALALNILVTPAGSPALNMRRADGWFFSGVVAVTVGALYFLNTWDYPTYLILVLLAALVRVRLVPKQPAFVAGPVAPPGEEVAIEPAKEGRWARIRRNGYARWLGWSAGLVAVSLALYLPFHLTFVSLVGDFPVPEPVASVPILGSIAKLIIFVAWDRTPLLGYLLVFGLFAFPILSFLVLKLWPYLKEPYAYLDEPGYNPKNEVDWGNTWSFQLATGGIALFIISEMTFYVLKLNSAITVILAIVALPFLGVGLALLGLETLERYRAERRAAQLRWGAFILAALMVAGGWILHFELYGPFLIVAIASGLLIWFESRPAVVELEAHEAPPEDAPQNGGLNLWAADRFVLLMILLAVVIDFGTELIIVRDVFNSRLNTLFKFYYQSWVLFGLAAAYASWRVLSWAWKIAPFNNPNEPERLDEVEPQPAGRLAGPLPQASLRLNPALGMAGGAGGNLAFRSLQMPTAPEAPRISGGSPALDLAGLDDPEAEEAEDYVQARPYRPWWRWLWAFGLGLCLLGGLVFPIFGAYEKTNHYTQRVGLDGSTWLRDGGSTGAGLPEDYRAIEWLKNQIAADPSFIKPILEASGEDWVDYSRVSTFTGLPTLMGWPGHENQWRGGKAYARPGTFDCGLLLAKYNLRPPQTRPSLQRDEPNCRLQLIDFIYSTDNVQLAQTLLHAAGVQYVYVGTLEEGLINRGGTIQKQYPPEGLTKFGQFMKVIYQSGSVTIYSF